MFKFRAGGGNEKIVVVVVAEGSEQLLRSSHAHVFACEENMGGISVQAVS
jgi:hypothetical protein